MEKLKRSEKHKLFKEHGVPRYLMLDEKEKKREQAMCVVLAFMMVVLAFAGKTNAQKSFGVLSLFLVNLIGVLSR
jgi:hypothetical protein